VIPNHVNKVYYVLAPVVVMIPALVTAAVIPWGSFLGSMRCVIADLDAGILFVFAIASLGVYGIVLAGWASNSKYPFLGGVRSSAQMISYEVCISLSVVPVFLQAGTLHLGSVIEYQTQHGWLILYQPLSFLFFLISSFAETNRLPFDLPEAEQELVSGYHTEYSSMKFGLFFMGEYANMIVASSLMVTLFLGGWSLPFGPLDAPASALWVGILHVLIFLAKVCLLLFVFIWVRWTLPRFRYDQLMAIGWKVFLPLTIVNIVICAALAGLGGAAVTASLPFNRSATLVAGPECVCVTTDLFYFGCFSPEGATPSRAPRAAPTGLGIAREPVLTQTLSAPATKVAPRPTGADYES
jgi:NADH-quinone oxidoreductase subunit H